MAKKIILALIVMVLITFSIFAQSNRKKIIVTKKMLAAFVTISNDEAVFEEDDLMKLYDQNGELLAYYGVFKHKSLEGHYNRKVFNKDKELLFSCIYVASGGIGTEYIIKFKDKDDKMGQVKVTKSVAFGINYKFDIDYYGEDYSMKYFLTSGFGGVQIENFLYKGNDIVMYWKKKGNVMSGNSDSTLYVHKDYMESNRMDVAYWTMIFFMVM